jgi:hypothetical protein
VDEKNKAFYMFQQLYDVHQKHWIVIKIVVSYPSLFLSNLKMI